VASSKPNLLNLPGSDKQLIGRLWRDYMRPYRGKLFIAIFFMTILAATTAGYALLIAYTIDTANALQSAEGDTASAMDRAKDFAKIVVPVIVGVTLISGIAMFIQSVLANSVSLHTIAGMQKAMFSRTHRADFAAFQREPVGNLISRFTNDVNILAQALLRTISNLIRDVLTVVFSLAIMLYLDWFITLLVLCVYPLAIAPIIIISKRLRGDSTDAQAQIGVITSQLNESLQGARMVRTYELEAYENQRLGKSFDDRIRLFLKLVTNKARVDPILEVLGGLAIASMFAIGVYRVSSGQTTPGQLAGLLTAIIAMSRPIRALGTLNNVVQEGLAALHRIFEVIDQAPTITDKNDAKTLSDIQGHVRFENVGFAYEDGTQALDHFNMEAKPGQTIALVGPSGGGKSTILNLLTRLYDVSGGHITVDGQDIRDVTLSSLRRSMALVSQDITVFDDTIAANIGLGDQSAGQDDIEAAAKAAAAHEFILEQPGGYQSRVGEDGGKLSGGQRQRIALARAMLRDAPILLLDEATSALDAESEAKVQSALDQLTKGRTVFVIAHRLSTVRKADKIYVLDQGQVIESGTHASLLKKKGMYAKLCELQFS
jgi:subfamily B ATP-binding cassette protein MsbA